MRFGWLQILGWVAAVFMSLGMGAGMAVADPAAVCAAAAQPRRGAGLGVEWRQLTPDTAIPTCEAAVAANPKDHASIAHLARAYSKAGDEARMAQLLLSIQDTTDPDALAYLAVLFANGAPEVEADPLRALEFAQAGAGAGHGYAMYRLALLYEDKETPFHDTALASEWLDRAIAVGSPYAIQERATWLRDGGAEDAEAQALPWFERALEAGYDTALDDLGRAYRWGKGVVRDDARALGYFQRGAELGLSFSSYYLALMYRDGLATDPDPTRAEALLRQAQAQGRNVAVYEFYQVWDKAGDTARAMPYLQQAVAAEEPAALSRLGRLKHTGTHVEQDVDGAIDLLVRASGPKRMFDLWKAWEIATTDRKTRIPELLVRIRDYAEAGDAGALERLGNAYEYGHGVPKDYAEAARYYRIAQQKGDPYAARALASLVNSGAVGFWDPAMAVALYQAASEGGVEVASVRLAEMVRDGKGVEKDYARVIQLLTGPAENGHAEAQFSLGYALINAEPPLQDKPAGAAWYRKAAMQEKDESIANLAASNLGELYEIGSGVDKDAAQARDWYGKAAARGHSRAEYKSALILIQDGTPEALAQAALYLAKASDGGWAKAQARLEQGYTDPADPLFEVLANPAPALAEVLETIGRGYEEARVDCGLFLSDCGRVAWQRLDLASAATWYRRAGDLGSARLRLGRLLLAHPDLAEAENEGALILSTQDLPGARVLATVTEGMTPEAANAAFDAALQGADPQEAVQVAALSVIGRYGDAAMGPGWRWLQDHAQDMPQARAGLLSVTLFMGAFDQAAQHLEQMPPEVVLNLETFDYSLSQSLRFLMEHVRQGVTPEPGVLDQIGTLLDAFATHAPERSAELRLMLDEVRLRLATRDQFKPEPLTAERPLSDRITHLQERIEKKTGQTGFSPLIVPLYQQLAELQAQAGDLPQARKAVYQSISFARAMNDATRHLQGSLVYHMEMACWLRKGSDMLFRFGDDAAGLTLAKASVNELQQARGRLVGLPQDLQNCFRDLLSTQYRRMADLLIRHDHLDEAQWVLGQLKDFETYQYADQDQALAGRAFDAMPMSAAQETVMQRIHGLPLAGLLDLRRQALALEEAGDDTAAKAMQAQLEQAQDALADSLDALADTVAELDESGDSEIPDEISARSLRRLGGRLKKLDGVAMVYSVSLPETTHFLIVSGQGTEHREIPLPQDQLITQIQTLRGALSDPRQDPRPAAQAFHSTVWAGVEEALDAAGAEHVLLSLDGLMRYVPIVALHDGQDWLLGRRDYVTFTSASRDLLLDDEALTDLSVEAFGATQGGAGFTPLPFALQEVRQIVGDQGQLAGRAWLDGEFNEEALADGLGSGAPVIHIATHFHLTDHEDSSAMLLGNGETLSVATLKSRARRGSFQLTDVQMLVLSACQTALAKGNELESFAATLQWEGVRSVVATLWPVADRSTSEFMVAFYKELKQGHSRALALRNVQRRFAQSDAQQSEAILRSGMALKPGLAKPALPGLQHPFYWAGFQLIGQWR